MSVYSLNYFILELSTMSSFGSSTRFNGGGGVGLNQNRSGFGGGNRYANGGGNRFDGNRFEGGGNRFEGGGGNSGDRRFDGGDRRFDGGNRYENFGRSQGGGGGSSRYENFGCSSGGGGGSSNGGGFHSGGGGFNSGGTRFNGGFSRGPPPPRDDASGRARGGFPNFRGRPINSSVNKPLSIFNDLPCDQIPDNCSEAGSVRTIQSVQNDFDLKVEDSGISSDLNNNNKPIEDGEKLPAAVVEEKSEQLLNSDVTSKLPVDNQQNLFESVTEEKSEQLADDNAPPKMPVADNEKPFALAVEEKSDQLDDNALPKLPVVDDEKPSVATVEVDTCSTFKAPQKLPIEEILSAKIVNDKEPPAWAKLMMKDLAKVMKAYCVAANEANEFVQRWAAL